MAHTPKYKNGIVLQQVTSVWAHLFQARQFQGKGDPRFDVSLILTAQQKEQLRVDAEALAVEAFANGEYNRVGAVEFEGVAPPPPFLWPYVPTESKVKSPKLAELFPGHFIISAKAYEDNPPQVMIPDSNNPGSYIPMPEGQRAQLVFDGALCYAGIDLASYESGPNVGIRIQLSFIVYYGAGTKVAVGAKPDANAVMAGINVQMQAPAGMAGAINTGQPAATGAVQQTGVVQQGTVVQQKPVQVAATVVQQKPAAQYQLADGTPCDADGNPIAPQVDFT